LVTEIQGQVQYSVFEHEAQLLAQRRFEADSVDCALLATDLQRSVLHSIAVGQHQQPVYSPYGHRSPEGGLISLLGFNGERRDPVTGRYLLGIGYRAFNPVLMRFNSPDSLSPFGKGGVNAYAYCGGDPLNRVDPMGNYFVPALVTGLARGALAQRVFRIVDAAISVPLAAAGRLSRGYHAGVNAINKLRPSYRAAGASDDAIQVANAERLKSIDDYVKAGNFVEAVKHAGTQEAAVTTFVGPRNLENGPAHDFSHLLENSRRAEVRLTKAYAEVPSIPLDVAQVRMEEAIQKWRSLTGYGAEDTARTSRLFEETRNVRR
jgi:RHS repeat-associated protein